eukprot:Em0011g1149a
MINVIILIVCLGLADAQTSFDVAITVQYLLPVPVPAYTSVSYGLVCAVTPNPGSVAFTWTVLGVARATVVTSVGTSTLPLTSPVFPTHAGLYVCNATANGVSRTASYALNITLAAPDNAETDGKIDLKITPPLPPYYAGSPMTLMCYYKYTVLESSVNVQFIWTGVNGSRWSVTSSSDGTGAYSTLTTSTLSLTDGGVVSCTMWVTPLNPSPYITDGNTTIHSSSFSVVDLALEVTVLPVTLRSVFSNSSFQINCTATKPPSVLLPFVFSWSWNDSYTGSVLIFNSSGVTTIGGTTFVMTQPPGVTNSTPTVTSTLIVSQPLPGVCLYRCDVMVSVPIDGPVSQTAVSSVFILGKTVPVKPVNITANKVSMGTITIQWTVPFVVYTLETYVVHYGSAPDNLNQSSILVNGSADLSVTGAQFGVNLTGLVPYSLYYYTIEASNTEGTTTTPVMTLSFFPPDGVMSLLVGSGDLTHLHVTWSPPPPPNNDVINYRVMATPFGGGGSSTIIVSDLYVNLTGTYAPGVPYNASVTGYNVVGYGKTITAYGYIQELAPSGLLSVKTTPINGSTIVVSWNPLSPVEARGFVRYYLVTWTPSSSKARGTAGSANLTADATMFLITGLDPMVTYTISVSAGTSAGVGAASNTSTMPVNPTTVMTTMATPTDACDMLCIIIIIIAGVIGCVIVAMVIGITTCACLQCRMKHRSVDLRMTNVMQEQEDRKSRSPSRISSDQLSGTEMNGGEPVASYDVIKSQGIPVAEFSAYVADNHHDRDKGFEMRYQAISMECKHPMEVAGFPCNKAKNRFHNISPYDYNRVCLSELDGEEGSDYINASYIDGHNQKHAYIVAQGPMPFTVRDFWRMIWQEQVNTIVMLTQCNEGGKRKCEQYWPEKVGDTIEPFPGLRVTMNEYVMFADYHTRKMSITNEGSEQLKISHFQFIGWPDHGVPHYSTSLLEFIKRVRNEHKRDGTPLLVHCSAGVGRSGAFIILDYLMQSMSEVLNIEECLASVREQRASMVQTLAQYVFIHDALNELIMCGDTHIEVAELAASIAKMCQTDPNTGMTGFQNQFKLLESVCHQPTLNDTSDARQEFNSNKNRYLDRLPYNRERVRLKTTGGVQGGEYINANFVDGYRSRNAYIAAQAPLQDTVKDFWRMVWEFRCMNIVVLCPLDEPGVCQYWPLRAGESYSFGKLSVSLESLYIEGYSYKLRLKDEKESTQQQPLQVTLFHHPGWSEMQCPEDTKSVISIAESVVKAQMQCGNASTYGKYITVVCNDGMGRTGAFITIHAMMERLKTEHMVDFFQFIKSSRTRRPNFVRSQEQYVYCHEVIADYVEMNGAYANFQDMSKSK